MFVEGLPETSWNGVIEVAAERVNREPTGFAWSSWRKEWKFWVLLTLIVLQPMPCWLGYSQLVDDH
jgi:hypothetical protein